MESIHSMKWGIIFSLLSLVFGFGIGIMFGGFEEQMEEKMKARGMVVLQEVYQGDEEKLDNAVGRGMNYIKRAHIHGNGLGTSALALIFVLTFVVASQNIKKYTALAAGIGALGYAFYWFLAGWMAPALGGTGVAKEALKWLAWPTSGLCVISLLAVLYLAITGIKSSKS